HVFHSERLALVAAAVTAACAVWWLALEISRSTRVALFAGLGFAASPLFIVHSGLFLSYLWTTALLTAGTAAGFNALRTRRAWMFAVVGVLFGLAQLTRPFDALLVAVPVAAYMAVRLLREGRATFLRDLAFAGIGIAPFLLITLVYNAHVTGSPLR